MSGVTASADLTRTIQDMSSGRVQYVVCRITGGEVVVEVQRMVEGQRRSDPYEAFLNALKSSGEPRYGVIDWNHKLCFVFWEPPTASARQRAMYAASADVVSDALPGIYAKLQATDDGELTEDTFNSKTKSKV